MRKVCVRNKCTVIASGIFLFAAVCLNFTFLPFLLTIRTRVEFIFIEGGHGHGFNCRGRTKASASAVAHGKQPAEAVLAVLGSEAVGPGERFDQGRGIVSITTGVFGGPGLHLLLAALVVLAVGPGPTVLHLYGKK